MFFHGDEARELAKDVNTALVAQAYEWVAARPDHPSFRDWTFPPPGPLIGVCDGDSVMSQQLRSTPPHRWQRLRRDWPGIPRKEPDSPLQSGRSADISDGNRDGNDGSRQQLEAAIDSHVLPARPS
jgi:hypothetical protein